MIETSLSVGQHVRRRARTFGAVAWLLLLSVVLSLLGGAYLFWSVGDLVSQDAEITAKLRRQALVELEIRREESRKRLDVLAARLQAEVEGRTGSKTGAGPVMQQLMKERDVESAEYQRLEGQIADARKEPERSAKLDFFSAQFVSATLSRVAIIFALILLLRVLVAAHIYALRMSAHFHVISDAIELSIYSPDPAKLNSLVQSLSPDRIAYPGVKDHPIDSIREILSSVNIGTGERRK